MQYLIQRLLIGWGLLIVVLWLALWSGDAAAGADLHATSIEANSHCVSDATSKVAAYNAAKETAGSAWRVQFNGCSLYSYNSPDNSYASYCECSAGCSLTNRLCSSITWTGSSSPINPHEFTTWVEPECTAFPSGTNKTHYASGVLPNPIQPSASPVSACISNCYFQYGGSQSDLCTWEDANSNGLQDDGETYECPYTYTSDGSFCESGDGIQETPDGNHFDCTNVQCGSDPAPGGGSNDSGSGSPVDPQNPVDNSGDDANDDPDSNPDTPGSPGSGSGSGDVDGDGDRDIDCNPQSNPDCNFTGSGTGSGSCDTQPSCTGDPVQCAILYQEWAAMCYDGGEFSNPGNCQSAFTCEGDVLLCEMIRQERKQYCDLFVGDGTQDLDPTNNVDFDRDLKDEAEDIDLPGSFDQTGFGAGSCPADYAVATSYGSVAISFASFCALTPAIRIFVIISALLAAVYIVVVGGKGNKD